MFTQCPHCYSIFRLGTETLAAAGGRVRCGTCEIIFNATYSLRDELPEAPADPWTNEELPFAAVDAGDETTADGAVAAPPPGASAGFRLNLVWGAGGAVLVLLLAIQLLFLAPRTLAAYPALRPAAGALCKLRGCELPMRQDLSKITLASRDVRAHPSVPGALIISATMVNEADFTQPYPGLEISLSDLQGRQVAARSFQPDTYLPDDVDIARGMAPDGRVQVSLEVVDPGDQAVAFEFDFQPAGQ